MKKNKEDRSEELDKEENEKPEQAPFCRTAASAEHARTTNDDEPCDDGRGGGTGGD